MSKVKSTKARLFNASLKVELSAWDVDAGTVCAVSDGVHAIRARICEDDKWGRYLWAEYPEDDNPVLFNIIMNGGNAELIHMLLPDAFYHDEKMTKRYDPFHSDEEYDRSLSDMYSIGTDPLDEWDADEMGEMIEERDEAASIVCDRMLDPSRHSPDFEMISDDRQTEIASGIITEIQRCLDNNWQSTWMMYASELEANFAQHVWPNTSRVSSVSVKFHVSDSVSEKKKENESRYIDDDYEYRIGNFYSAQSKSQLPVLLAIEGEPCPPDLKTFSHK